MDLSSVAPNSTPPRPVNSQLVSLPPYLVMFNLYHICLLRAFEHIHMEFARYKCLLRAFEHIHMEFARYKCLLLLLLLTVQAGLEKSIR